MSGPIKVLVVDDSAFARKVIRETLSAARGIEVVGIARDGLEALELIGQLMPDVITLDLMMPNLDGLGVLRALPRGKPPHVVVVSMAEGDGELGVAALQAGAFDLVHKPNALATDRLYELGDELIAKVRAAAAAPFNSLSFDRPAAETPLVPTPLASRRIVLIGTSTGGPQALTYLLRALPAHFPAPIAIVVHMPPGYTDSFARRLNDECAIKVVEASDGLALVPGVAAIARAGVNLKIQRGADGYFAKLDPLPLGRLHCPSVDVLFASAAEGGFGSDALGVVLTGMGDDGLLGAGELVRAGGTVLAEAESSCVVYGMPRCITEARLAVAEAPLELMGATILRYLSAPPAK